MCVNVLQKRDLWLVASRARTWSKRQNKLEKDGLGAGDAQKSWYHLGLARSVPKSLNKKQTFPPHAAS